MCTTSSAARNSVNTFYLQLLERTGVERPAQIAEAFGRRQFVDGSPTAPLHRGGSFVLGVNEVSPLAMSAAYAGFAARGLYCPPRPVLSVTRADGTEVALPEQAWTQAIAPEIADTMASIMRGVVDGRWSRTARRALIDGQYYPQVYGGTLPAPIWRDITGPALAASPVLDLPPPAVSDPQPVRRRDRASDRDDLG